MSKADKMFEELGYKQEKYELFPNVFVLRYYDRISYKSVSFNLDKKFYSVSCMNENFEEVTKAINEKCKELRMDMSKQEHEFLDSLLIEVYKANFTQEQLNKMTVDEKKDYIKQTKSFQRLEGWIYE